MAASWLEEMLKTHFFTDCKFHHELTRKECNLYCIDCHGEAFCFYCKSSNHKNHQVIQIRRSSYHNVVRVSEIEKKMDISGVRTYRINSARVLFLNKRPQMKLAAKGITHICEVCSRNLLDLFRFCSLGCKIVGVKRKKKASFPLTMGGRESISSREEEEVEELCEGSKQDVTYPLPNSTSTSTRRRKGFPRRAPSGP